MNCHIENSCYISIHYEGWRVKDTTGRYVGFWFTERDAIRDYSDLRKSGKASRQCFGSQREKLQDIWEDKRIPPFFKDLYRKDVSENYYQDTLRMSVAEKDYDKYAFLGVFNPHGWIGIDMAKIEDGEAVFPHVESKVIYQLNIRELKLCYLVRARLSNKTISILFNITPRSVLKAKQRMKTKLALSAMDSLDIYIQYL